MNQPRKVTALLLAALLGVAYVRSASQAYAAPSGFFTLTGGHASTFVLPSGFTQVSQIPVGDVTLVRYQQVFDGAKVLGGQISVHKDASGRITTVIGANYPHILGTNEVRLTAEQAAASVSDIVGSVDLQRSEMMIDPQTGLFFHRVESLQGAQRWFHHVDAQTGGILVAIDGTMKGCGQAPNTVSAPCGHGVEYEPPLQTSDVKNLSGLTVSDRGSYLLKSGKNPRQVTYDALNSNTISYAAPAADADNSWVTLGNVSPSQQALVDVHYYGDVTDDFYLNTLGFDWVRAGGRPMRLTGHFGQNFNNAFWMGSGAVFGDGDQVLFRELTSLDVVAHELAHGTIQFTSNLEYRQEPGALNESFADIMGTAAEYYADKTKREPAGLAADFFIGEDIALTADVAPGFRNLADPEEDQDPDHYSEKKPPENVDNGYVHSNSGIPNHAFYLLSEGGTNASCASPVTHMALHCLSSDLDPVPGVGIDKAATIFFRGLTALPETAGFCEARAATIAVAGQLGSSGQTGLAWDQVGVTTAACATPYQHLTLHVGDLDGSMTAASGRTFNVTITVTVHDNDEKPVTDAGVYFYAPDLEGTIYCETGAEGTCTVTGTTTKRSLHVNVWGIYHVRSYDPADNHDPDGDSDGTYITLRQ